MKTYQQPYRVFSEQDPDAHEALGGSDFCMAYYDDNDNVVVLNNSVQKK